MAERKVHRARVRIAAEYRTDNGDAFETSVIDLSETGCRMRQRIAAPAKGTGISIAIGNLAPVSAHVEWRYGAFFGLSFTRPLPATLVDHLGHVHARGRLNAGEMPRP